LLKSEPDSNEELIYHFRRSFTEGDNNFEGQLLYARQLYISGNIAESRKLFGSLSKAHIPPQTKTRLLYPMGQERFSGRIWKIETAHGFVLRDGTGDTIFMHSSNVAPGLWKNLTGGTRIRFSIAFTFRGLSAFDVEAPGITVVQPKQIALPLGDESA
jgi:cold shock CspA family protein